MTCNDCASFPRCMERSREYICREFKYDKGYGKTKKTFKEVLFLLK